MAQPRQITLDGQTVTASADLWAGPDQKLGLGVFTSEGIVGHWVERLGPGHYRSLGLVEAETMAKVLRLIHQAV